MEPEVECEDCGWQGLVSELLCSEEDAASDKSVSEIKFNQCPDCNGTNIVDFEQEME